MAPRSRPHTGVTGQEGGRIEARGCGGTALGIVGHQVLSVDQSSKTAMKDNMYERTAVTLKRHVSS